MNFDGTHYCILSKFNHFRFYLTISGQFLISQFGFDKLHNADQCTVEKPILIKKQPKKCFKFTTSLGEYVEQEELLFNDLDLLHPIYKKNVLKIDWTTYLD